MDSMDHQDLASTVQRIDEQVRRIEKEALPAMQGDIRRMETSVERLEGTTRCIARNVVVMQSDLGDIKETMATKADIHKILEAIDAFSGMARSFNDSKTIHGQSLTEAEVKLRDHERRIKDLEDRLQ